MAAVDVLPVAFFHHAIVTTMAGMALRLHHIVIDAHDLPALARFWAQALDWLILSEREQEVVIGPDETAPVGMCFMPVPEGKCSEGRVGSASAGISQHMLILDRHFDSAADRHCWDDHRVALPPP